MKCTECKRTSGVVHCDSKTCHWRYCENCRVVIGRDGKSFKKQ